MSLGEIQQVSEGIYAYLQPDGSWWRPPSDLSRLRVGCEGVGGR